MDYSILHLIQTEVPFQHSNRHLLKTMCISHQRITSQWPATPFLTPPKKKSLLRENLDGHLGPEDDREESRKEPKTEVDKLTDNPVVKGLEEQLEAFT